MDKLSDILTEDDLFDELPQHWHEHIPRIIAWIDQIEQGADVTDFLHDTHVVRGVLRALAGQKLEREGKLIDFGLHNQYGNVRIGDVAGGNITKTFEIHLPKLSQEEQAERRERERLIGWTRLQWIEGVLQQSLHHEVHIELELQHDPDKVDYPASIQVSRPNATEALKSSRDVYRIFAESIRRLLILGAPGAGKTTILLKLAELLLRDAELDTTVPIPVVFNLSSWQEKRLPLQEWVSDELKNFHVVQKKQKALDLLQSGKLLLLLDGLDEVAEQYRGDCIAAINAFLAEMTDIGIVVCCRSRDLPASPQLQLQLPVEIQLLTPVQIDSYLNQLGEQAAPARLALDSLQQQLDPEHEDYEQQDELLRTPLILNMLLLAYRETPVAEITPNTSWDESIQHLFNTYITRMIQRSGKGKSWQQRTFPYPQERTIHWLSWLASKMHYHNQSIFRLESLQPDWWDTPEERHLRRRFNWLDRGIGALVGGLFLWVMFLVLVLGYYEATGRTYQPGVVLADSLIFLTSGILAGGLFGGNRISDSPSSTSTRVKHILCDGLAGVVIGGGVSVGLSLLTGNIRSGLGTPPLNNAIAVVLLSSLMLSIISGFSGFIWFKPRRIEIVEVLVWSWSKAVRWLPITLVSGASLGYGVGFQFERVGGKLDELYGDALNGTSLGIIAGVLIGLIVCMLTGFDPQSIAERHQQQPNQGVRRSAFSALIAAMMVTVATGMAAWFVAEGPITWLMMGSMAWVIGWFTWGGYACITHYALRIVAARSGTMPFRYRRFLNYAQSRTLLFRVGNGYAFVHRLLLEHFARGDARYLDTPGTAGKPSAAPTSFRILFAMLHKNLPLVIILSILLIIIAVVELRDELPEPVPPRTEQVQISEDMIHSAATLSVNAHTLMHDVCVLPNQTLVITASGIIKLGNFVGYAGPAGTERGLFGLPLGDVYDLEHAAGMAHGALICKLDTERDWQHCGAVQPFVLTPQTEGCLEFDINDAEQTNNEAAFDVHVLVLSNRLGNE